MMKPKPVMIPTPGENAWTDGPKKNRWYVALYGPNYELIGWVECDTREQGHTMGKEAVTKGASSYAVTNARPSDPET